MIDIKAKKSLGQNFLVNRGILEKIIDAAEVTSNDKVIEVGPGKGALTELLAERAGTVIAIEKDHRLIEHLSSAVGMRANTEVIEGDVLEWTPPTLAGEYKIVANLPYYITSHFLRMIFESWPRPKLAVLMVQKEVAQRMMAQPPHTNLLALSVQAYAVPELVTHVSRGSFRPAPNVDSSVIRLTLLPDAPAPERMAPVFDLIKHGFSSKRKQLAAVLGQKTPHPKEWWQEQLENLGLPATARPENLSLDQWRTLADRLAAS